jgi:hypothetical protein
MANSEPGPVLATGAWGAAGAAFGFTFNEPAGRVAEGGSSVGTLGATGGGVSIGGSGVAGSGVWAATGGEGLCGTSLVLDKTPYAAAPAIPISATTIAAIKNRRPVLSYAV